MKKISILIPCYNEEKTLPLLYTELEKIVQENNQYRWEILFINDGSKDKTLEIIKNLKSFDTKIGYIDLSRNYGKEVAMLAGFDYVTGDCSIIMDADLQHPPSVIPEMIQLWEEGYDDVYGKRISRGKESFLRKNLSLLFYKILQKISNIEIIPNVGDFRLLDRKCIDSLKNIREQERYTKGLYSWIGFKKTFIEFETKDRIAGESSFNMLKLILFAIQGITSFSTSPLRISSFLGMIISLGSFVYLLFVVAKTILLGESVQGFPTLLITILLLGGIQLITIGIIGEYVGRIFNETKNRPTYFINEYIVSE
jgi:polyisoprenyl-phosphate glycosyltransferase